LERLRVLSAQRLHLGASPVDLGAPSLDVAPRVRARGVDGALRLRPRRVELARRGLELTLRLGSRRLELALGLRLGGLEVPRRLALGLGVLEASFVALLRLHPEPRVLGVATRHLLVAPLQNLGVLRRVLAPRRLRLLEPLVAAALALGVEARLGFVAPLQLVV